MSTQKAKSDKHDPGEHEELEQYAGGEITDRPGKVNWWLAGVYAVLFIWALFYRFVYWGGLGPGLDY